MSKAKKKTPEASLPLNSTMPVAALPPTRVAPASGHADQVRAAFPWGWVPLETAQVAASWRQQVLIVPIDGQRVRIQARLDVGAYGGVDGYQSARDDRLQAEAGAAGQWPLTGDLIVIGSIPGPIPSLPGEAATRQAALREVLHAFHVDSLTATFVDRAHAWTEPAVVAVGYLGEPGMTGTWQERTLERAREYGFDHAVRVRGGAWQVLRLSAPRVSVETSDACSITRDVEARCPMLREPAAGEYCRMVGGPYTSRSIHASAAWKAVRDDLVAVVGCDTCEGVRYRFQDRIMTGGGPISITESALPSRWLAADDTRLVDGEAGDE